MGTYIVRLMKSRNASRNISGISREETECLTLAFIEVCFRELCSENGQGTGPAQQRN
jgi:hypothetical protein